MTEGSVAHHTAAARLLEAHASGQPCSPLRDLLDAQDVDGGYAVQEMITAGWLRQGRRLVGRKIGLTSAAIQSQLGVDQPDYGMLFADMCFNDAEEIPWGTVIQPRAESEIAFVLGRDLDLEHITSVDVIRATEYLLPAIEVVGSRVENWDIRIMDTIADNASSGVYALGSRPVRISDVDLRHCGMVLERRGDPVSVGAGAACMGHPLTAVVWLARKMVEVGRPLREGDTVLSGALGPMVPVAPGDVLECRIEGLGEVRAVFGREG